MLTEDGIDLKIALLPLLRWVQEREGGSSDEYREVKEKKLEKNWGKENIFRRWMREFVMAEISAKNVIVWGFHSENSVMVINMLNEKNINDVKAWMIDGT